MRRTDLLWVALLVCTLLLSSVAVYAQEQPNRSPEVAEVERPILEALAAELDMTPRELMRILTRVKERVQEERPFVSAARGPLMGRTEALQERVRERIRSEGYRGYMMGHAPGMVRRSWQPRAEDQFKEPMAMRPHQGRPLLRRAWTMERGRPAPKIERPMMPVRALLRTLLAEMEEIEWRTEDGQLVKPRIVWEPIEADE